MSERSLKVKLAITGDPDFQNYFLEDVVPTGRILGRGSCAPVIEVKHKGSLFAAKQIPEATLDHFYKDTEDSERYKEEFQRMAGLMDLHIVKFHGLCSLENSEMPALIMERLEMTVDDFLVNTYYIPLSVKLSILIDTCSGLQYLHSKMTPIVHGELTAKNVLLSSSLTAKITDFGYSRMIQDKIMSRSRGALVYLPSKEEENGPAVDVFSFGCLSLYVLNQVFPGNLTDSKPEDQTNVKSDSEAGCRQQYIDMLQSRLGQSHPGLLELVHNCLKNRPSERTSCTFLLKMLIKETSKVDASIGTMYKQEMDIDKVLLVKEMKASINELECYKRDLEKELEDCKQIIANKLPNNELDIQKGDESKDTQNSQSNSEPVHTESKRLSENAQQQKLREEELADIKREIKGKQLLVERMGRENREKVAALEKKMTHNQSKLTREKQEILERLEKLNSEHQKLQNTYLEQQQSHIASKDQSGELSKVTVSLESEKRELQYSLESLKNKYEGKIKILEDKNIDYQDSLKKLRIENKEKEASLVDLQSQEKYLKKSIEELKNVISTHKNKKDELERNASAQEDNLQRLELDNTELSRQLRQLEEKHKRVLSESKRLEDKLITLEKENENYKHKLKDLSSENEQLKIKNTTDQLVAGRQVTEQSDQINQELLEGQEEVDSLPKGDSESDERFPMTHEDDDHMHTIKRLEDKIKELEGIREQLRYSNDCKNTAFHNLSVTFKKLQKKITYQLSFPLHLDWEEGPVMKKAMENYIQCVEVKGMLYVGGGWTESGEEGIVMAYEPILDEWHVLPPYNAKEFAMATINEKLLLIGGSKTRVIGDLGVWCVNTQEWETPSPFPPMPTSRCAPSAATYNEWLIVAGGVADNNIEVATVEVLDVANKQWHTGPPTPMPWHRMRSTVIRNTWYLFGGGYDWSPSFDIYSTSLKELVSYSTMEKTLWTKMFSSNPWRKSGSIDYYNSCPLKIGEFLFSVGGMNSDNKPVSTIQCYDPVANTWTFAGHIPHKVHNCAAIMLFGKICVMGGHNGAKATNSMHKSDF